jgi:hypothetical protein
MTVESSNPAPSVPVVLDSELLPCPFCASTRARIVTERYLVSGHGATAACEECGTFTSTKKGTTEPEATANATAAWNRRAALSASAQPPVVQPDKLEFLMLQQQLTNEQNARIKRDSEVADLRAQLAAAQEELERVRGPGMADVIRASAGVVTAVANSMRERAEAAEAERDDLRRRLGEAKEIISEARDGYVINELPCFAEKWEQDHQRDLIDRIDVFLATEQQRGDAGEVKP